MEKAQEPERISQFTAARENLTAARDVLVALRCSLAAVSFSLSDVNCSLGAVRGSQVHRFRAFSIYAVLARLNAAPSTKITITT